ncbi:hypothetical protein L596_017210 [Steinernema carpocapsae]|uniref:SH2 domain-containing protein n=1 Tax=Steinernema carpocapsae TaxID=34508 RepID=A0A4U5N102_STECR|nr:hypothetical protein L596_017210 [Steinernema carpocapsae]
MPFLLFAALEEKRLNRKESDLNRRRGSLTVFENVGPEDAVVGVTNAHIRQWLYGQNPFSEVSELEFRSRSISIGSEDFRRKIPKSDLIFEAEETEPMTGKSLSRPDFQRAFLEVLSVKNQHSYAGFLTRDAAEKCLLAQQNRLFLLYHRVQDPSTELASLTFLYFSKRRLFHHFPVRTTRVLKPHEEQLWWEGREQVFLFAQDVVFSSLNDLVDFYVEHISKEAATSDKDPFEGAYCGFQKIEKCRVHKIMYGRCCGGRFHKTF